MRKDMKKSDTIKRFRDYGFVTGLLPTGRRNKISDVRGVRVGHQTRIEGDAIRTGVTLIDPGVENLFHDKLPAAVGIGNGYGKLAGATQVQELGTLETPIALTNTLAIGAAMRGLIELVLRITPDMPPATTINAVVGETNDGKVNDIYRCVISSADVAAAYDNRAADFTLGSVGAGTGTCAFSWKGGIGSASRVVQIGRKKHTVGALLQTNFGGALTILGVPIGKMLGKMNFDEYVPPSGDGSCMMILATDAPLSSRQLGRIARRAPLGLGRTGSVMAHGSGDYAIAFSTSRAGVEGSGAGDCLPDTALTPFFLAAIEAVEESVYDSLFTAGTMTGHNGYTLEQLPLGKVVKMLNKHIRK